MSFRILLPVAFACLAVVGSNAIADPSPRKKLVTSADVLERALNESPLVTRIEASIALMRAEGLQNGTVENPVLDSEVRVPTSYGDQRGSDEVALSLSQPLRVSDFGARGNVNRLIQALADEDRRVELLTFAQKVKLAYTKAWALERRSLELARYRDTAGRIERAVQHAADGGLLGSSEGLLFRAEAKKTQLELNALTSDLKRAKAELNRIAGFAVAGTLVKPPLSDPPSLPALLGSADLLPAQARAKMAVALAREQHRQSELDAYPKFSPRLVFERTNDSASYFGVGISMELPFFDRNQGERLARNAEAHAAQRFAAYLSGDSYRDEVSSLLESLQASTAFLNGYEQEILPTLSQALDTEEKLFTAGKGAPVRLWQILRELSAAQREVLERLMGLYSDRIELVAITGTDF
jgi:cobalt-zinc-cadmium efflux system outer membrane protein